MVLFWNKQKKFKIKSLFKRAIQSLNPEICTRIKINDYSMEINLMRGCTGVHTATAYKHFLVPSDIQDFAPDSTVNIYAHPAICKNIKHDFTEDKEYFYGYKQFENYFYYRKHKEGEVYDLILPPHDYNLEALDNVFRMIFSSKCIDKQMILMHASTIIRENKAILFIGQSGAGKSTIAGLSGHKVLHDDLIALKRIDDSRFRIMTLPFKPMFKKYEFVGEIDCIYRIYQSLENKTQEINKQEQIAQLLFSLWSFDDFRADKASTQDRDILRFCRDMSQDVTVKNLYFTKSNDFLKLI